MIMFAQTMDTMHSMLQMLDSAYTGLPAPERSYATDCSLSWATITRASDVFVLSHSIGWFGKMLMLRDVWLCHVLSFMFELLEYIYTYTLPNFAECWWDHVRLCQCNCQ